uniref:Early lactation protein-like n=1 Tax=Callorhinus ursinus TaxID=34884 RepID=A0A3Q7PC33_CALUR|nr:early lactation protein-like [Callorhinus ursinus]
MKFSPFLVLCVLLCLVGIASSAHLKQEVPWELSQALPAVCQLPPARGPCRGVFSRYFYNDTSSECEHFAYGGCQGNANNFETTEICLRICKHPGESSYRNRRSNAGDRVVVVVGRETAWWRMMVGSYHGNITMRGDGDGNNQMRHQEVPVCLVMGVLGWRQRGCG